MTRTTITSTLLATLLLAGCAHQPDPAADARAAMMNAKYATIRFKFFPGVETVDGVETDRPKWSIPLAQQETSVPVSPGEREIVASITNTSASGSSSRRWRFRYVFEAGHTYKFDAGWGPVLKVRDEQTGIVVAVGR
jgi:hypothetical protein